MSIQPDYHTSLADHLLMLNGLDKAGLLEVWRDEIDNSTEAGHAMPLDVRVALHLFDKAQASIGITGPINNGISPPTAINDSAASFGARWGSLYNYLSQYVELLEDIIEADLSSEQILHETKAILDSTEWKSKR